MSEEQFPLLKKSKRRPYEATKVDSEITQVKIYQELEKYGVPRKCVQIAIMYNSGQIGLQFQVSTIINEKRIPLSIRMIRQASSRRVRVLDRLSRKMSWEQVYNMEETARMLFHLLKVKLEAVSSGFSTVEEEFLPYITFATKDGSVRTIGDALEPVLESNKLSIEGVSSTLALEERPPENQRRPEKKVIEAEYNESIQA